MRNCRYALKSLGEAAEGRNVLYAIITCLERRYLYEKDGQDQSSSTSIAIGAVAACITSLVAASRDLKKALVDWLAGVSPEASGHSHLTHRAVVLALSQDSGISLRVQCTR